jgi:glycosyltransferase involved in cell wall biosynthesis
MSMLIAIDGNEANIKQRVGVNEFAYQTISHIHAVKDEEKYQQLEFMVFLSSDPLKTLPEEDENWQYEVFGPTTFWTWTGLVKRLFLGKPRPDVLFSPSHYGPGLSPIPFVSSIMDLGFLRWQDQFTKKDFLQLKYWTKWSAKRAAKIITISEFTKQDIVDQYNIKKEKIEVIYPGISRQTTRQQKNEPGKYFLYLGTLKPSKNITRLIKAFKKVHADYPDYKLIIAGKKGWLYKQIFYLVEDLDLQEAVLFPGFVSEAEKNKLLANAEAYVLPSLWEGFGIPVLEAMRAGTPVICTKIASLPEVGKDAPIYINNPENTEEIDLAMRKVLKLTKQERKELISKGYKRVKKFKWQDSARKILEVLINEAE